MLDKLLQLFKGDIVKDVGNIVDGLATSDEEKSQAKERLSSVVFDALNKGVELQASVMKTEMTGNFLQRSWRPIVMLAFVGLLVIRWLGLVEHHIAAELELELMQIIKIGLGGYVVGRSVEKTAEVVTKNIDLPFVKKKNR